MLFSCCFVAVCATNRQRGRQQFFVALGTPRPLAPLFLRSQQQCVAGGAAGSVRCCPNRGASLGPAAAARPARPTSRGAPPSPAGAAGARCCGAKAASRAHARQRCACARRLRSPLHPAWRVGMVDMGTATVAERRRQGALQPPPLLAQPVAHGGRLWGCCVAPAVKDEPDACGAAAAVQLPVQLPLAGKAAGAAAAPARPPPPRRRWAAWRRAAAAVAPPHTQQQCVAAAATQQRPAAAVTAGSAAQPPLRASLEAKAQAAADIAAPRKLASQHSSELLVTQLVPACSSSGGASCQRSADTAGSSSSAPRTPDGLVVPQLSRHKLLLLQSGMPASAQGSLNSIVPPEPLSTSRSTSCSCQATVSSTVGSSIVAPASSSTAALASLAEAAAAVEAATVSAAPAAGASDAAGVLPPPPHLPVVPEQQQQQQTAASTQAAAAPSSTGSSDTAQAEGAAAPAVQLAPRLPRTSSSNTPFAQLAYQQAVACDLLAEPQQQPEQHQQGSVGTQPAGSAVLPLLGSGAGLGGSTSVSATASAQLAPMPSGAAAAARAAGASAAAAAGSPFVLAPPVATRSSSRVSWGASSVAVLEHDVFGVLDPETASVSSGRILQHSASSSSLAGGTAGSSSSSDAAPDKLQALRSMLLRGQSTAGAAVAGSSRLKGVLRRGTHVPSSGSNGLMQTSSGSRHWQRSRSMHGLAELQQPAAAAAAAGATHGLTASTSFAGHGSSSLPPLPPSASLLPCAASCPLPPGGHAGGSTLLAGGSSGGSSIGSRSTGTALLERPGTAGSSAAGARSSASLAGSASSGSLVALAVNRMHSAPAPGGADSNSSSSTGSNSRDGRWPLAHSRSTGALGGLAAASSAAGDCCNVARAFADAFLAALVAGNTKWASDSRVPGLLHEAARMVGLDKHVYDGRTAIIRRLNGGMEQLVRTVAAHASDGASDGAAAAPAGAADGGGAALADDGQGAANGGAGWGRLPPPGLSVSCPDPKRRPGHVTAVYSFRLGLRKFTLRDEFIVKSGQILRLRRTRG